MPGHGQRHIQAAVDLWRKDGLKPSTIQTYLSFLRGLAGVNLVGMDLVEVCPALDHADLTGHLAAHLLFEGLALAALRSR